jgi:signal transduction histidine kinase
MRDSGAVSFGPAMTTLRSVVSRLATVVRCAGIAYIAVQVAIWHSFYLADSWRLAGPIAAMAWAAVVAVYLRRRWPGALFVSLDSAFYVALAIGAQGCVPTAIRDDAFSWLVIVISTQLVVPAWCAPAGLSVPLTLASPVAYWIGAEQMANPDRRTMTMATILLIIVASVHLYGRRQLYSRAAAADAALEEADRDASEQYVILSRNLERREHERLVHDTVLNTLTALARAERLDGSVNRCREDIALIERALSDPGIGSFDGGLVARIHGIAAEMGTRGLNVHVDVAGDSAPTVPAAVATALSNAAREALSNVALHAGTEEAWVEVSHLGGSGAQVTVRDNGTGFDLTRIDQARLGLRRSIVERTADCGGQASVWSAPGQGTVVRLSWREQTVGSLPW